MDRRDVFIAALFDFFGEMGGRNKERIFSGAQLCREMDETLRAPLNYVEYTFGTCVCGVIRRRVNGR